MLFRCLLFMLPLVGLALSAQASAPRVVPTAVSIRIHDYSAFEERQLQQAQRQVSQTYARIGVRLDWRERVRPADVQAGLARWPVDGPATVTIVVLSREMAARLDVPSRVAGYAPITREQGGRIAYVFGSRTREIAREGQVDAANVLAGIISHEIAHLLMPARSHSDAGLMREHWRPAEFRRIEQKQFSSAEASAIRQSIQLMGGGLSRVAD